MMTVSDIETAIFQELSNRGPCHFDDLAKALPTFSWNQLFLTVDRLSRSGRLKLMHPARVGFHVAIAADTTPAAPSREAGA